MTAVESAITEVKERLAAFAPQHEGLRDFARLNINEGTREAVVSVIDDYDRRKRVLDAALAALEALMADGHPNLDIREVETAVFNDLKENAATIEAALARFTASKATSFSFDAGAPGPK